MPFFSRPSLPNSRRRLDAGNGTVTFIVTLAATRNVTLAARAAGMSRKGGLCPARPGFAVCRGLVRGAGGAAGPPPG